VALEQRCNAGHFYDTSKHTTCPYCGVPGLDIGKTTPNRAGAGAEPRRATQPKDSPTERGGDPGVTVPLIKGRIGIDPVVGWLVCVDGPDRGRDYKIRSENNSIGRSETMQICIDGDDAIARENHAFVSYDPESNAFTLLPGNARGLVYLNRGPVYSQVAMKAFDQIKLGNTTLIFVPLCGDHHRWT
jgi:hypothetical protein